jgi:hypothetical protein
MLRKTLKFAAFIGLALAGVCVSLNAQDYDIKLDRPFKAGAKYRIAYQETLSSVKKVNQKDRAPSQGRAETNIKAKYEVKVLTVGPEGFPSREEIEVLNLESSTNGASMEIVPKGARVQAALQGGKAVFMLDGAEVPEQAAKLLRKTTLIGNLGDERVFKMSGKRKPGDVWEPDMDLISKIFARSAKRQGGLTAKSSFEKLVELDGGKCFELESVVETKSQASASSMNEMTIKIKWLLPLDPAKHLALKTTSQKIHARQVFREVETLSEMSAESEMRLEE